MKLSAMIFVSVFLSCKPAGSDGPKQVAQIDNFSGGANLRSNSCSSDPRLNLPNPIAAVASGVIRADQGTAQDPKLAEYKQAVIDSMSAVPAAVQILFLNAGGFIEISNTAADQCQAPHLNGPTKPRGKGLSDFKSCVKYTINDNQYELKLLFPTDKKEIYKSSVRLFGYLWAKVYPNMYENPQSGRMAIQAWPPAILTNYSIILSQLFLMDMVRTGAFSLKGYERYLGQGSAGQITANAKALQGDITKLVTDNFTDASRLPVLKPNAPNLDLLNNVSFLLPGETQISSEVALFRRRSFETMVFTDLYDATNCNSWSDYSKAKAEQAFREGGAATEKFLKSNYNTQGIFRDFFPLSYGYFAQRNQELHEYSVEQAKKSKYLTLSAQPNGFGLQKIDSNEPGLQGISNWLENWDQRKDQTQTALEAQAMAQTIATVGSIVEPMIGRFMAQLGAGGGGGGRPPIMSSPVVTNPTPIDIQSPVAQSPVVQSHTGGGGC